MSIRQIGTQTLTQANPQLLEAQMFFSWGDFRVNRLSLPDTRLKRAKELVDGPQIQGIGMLVVRWIGGSLSTLDRQRTDTK